VKGEEHWANASDPQIPAALKPVVAGFASLNNFPRKPMYRLLGTFSKSKATGEVKPLFTLGSNSYALGPTDFATIYNVLPLWNAGSPIDGTGQQIAVVAQTNINIQDVADFRNMFSLPTLSAQSNTLCQAPATTPQVPVNICLNGPDPGIVAGDETESDLDVQWSGGVAEGATIDLVVSQSTEVTAGVDLSALYIIDNNLAPVMSESYGLCEAALGSGGNAFYRTLWEQGAAQGITILIAAGDNGSAGCDHFAGETAALYGLAVSGLASTPFNVAVGGTDFSDVNNWSTYWSAKNNSTTLSSAISYIPEMTWNDSCANTASTGQLNGCASAGSNTSDLEAAGGGPSAVYTRPSWQTGPTGWVFSPDDARDTPDVSLFAAVGSSSGSFYAMCEADALAAGESSCDRSAATLYFVGAGGTSASVQAFAGIMALVNEEMAQVTANPSERQGNANYVLYPLAAGAVKNSAYCPSSASSVGNSSCIFYDVTSGNNSVACVAGSPNCSNTGTSGYGILVVPSSYTSLYGASAPGWPTSAGYDLATGLGTVNAANLVNNWSSVAGTFTPTTTTLISPTAGSTYTHGQAVTVSVTVAPQSGTGTPTGDVSLIGGPSGGTLGIGPFTLSNGAIPANTTTTMLPGGTYNVTAHYAGDGTYGASDSAAQQVTVTAEPSQTFVALVTYNPTTGQAINPNATSVTYGSAYLMRVDVTNSVSPAQLCYNSPAYQCPTGQVTVTDTVNGQQQPITDVGAPADNTPGTYTLNSQGFAEDRFIQLPVGTDALVATYTPHPIAIPPTACEGLSYCTSKSATADTITVTKAPTNTTVTASNTSPASGASVTLTATVGTSSMGLGPSGTVQFQNNGIAMSGAVSCTPVNASAASYASCTATFITSFTANASVTAVYSGDSNYTGSTSPAVQITIATGAPDFSFPTATTIIIASSGQSGSETISPAAVNGFSGTVNVTCAVPSNMTYSTCSLNPTSFSVPGGSTLLTVTTTAPSTALPLFNRPHWFIPSAGALFACIFLLLIPGKKRRVKLAFGLLVFALLAAAFVACGGGGHGPSSPGTPTGTYTVVVTGTSGTLSHTLNVVVIVQ
jgi:hypothetical protein